MRTIFDRIKVKHKCGKVRHPRFGKRRKGKRFDKRQGTKENINGTCDVVVVIDVRPD